MRLRLKSRGRIKASPVFGKWRTVRVSVVTGDHWDRRKVPYMASHLFLPTNVYLLVPIKAQEVTLPGYEQFKFMVGPAFTGKILKPSRFKFAVTHLETGRYIADGPTPEKAALAAIARMDAINARTPGAVVSIILNEMHKKRNGKRLHNETWEQVKVRIRPKLVSKKRKFKLRLRLR